MYYVIYSVPLHSVQNHTSAFRGFLLGCAFYMVPLEATITLYSLSVGTELYFTVITSFLGYIVLDYFLYFLLGIRSEVLFQSVHIHISIHACIGDFECIIWYSLCRK